MPAVDDVWWAEPGECALFPPSRSPTERRVDSGVGGAPRGGRREPASGQAGGGSSGSRLAGWCVPRLLRTRSGTIGLNLNRVKLHKGGKRIRDPVETSRTLSDPWPARIRGIRPPCVDCPAETNSRCVCACVGLFSPRLLACLFVCGEEVLPGAPAVLTPCSASEDGAEPILTR